ncbi:transposase [Vibrio parahaemolyticus]|uniref:Uncharacterized protein n=1 Tax=Vibrio parahaemolyticus serotype O3:K6 (strain RIMD 2210633) TaxID=223926 RepID=Q87GE2_VIBPA|nr:transposase [Vibrio parahaemolyticus]BAC62717.1 hypothetical protein, probable transposase [Vibrio parahaemolyticus RIMD 2210633]OKY42702.1 transposase [Vibrio parahaemolyticus]OKY50237.1 transposase [Vibrio parahaemolyticus]RFD32104.1 transposase [Vibrio parahaemolyticus]
MLHTSNPIIKHKAGFLNLEEELGNILLEPIRLWVSH